MSKEKRRVPKLRFPGFTEDWEQRKLSDVLIERNEQQVETREYPLMSFVQGLGVTPKGERYDRSFLVLDQSKKYKRTELGDFIYSSNNLETGSIGINKTGKAVISPVYSIFQGVSIGDSQFIGIMSLLPRFIAKMIRFRQGVVYGQWRIHETDFLDISVLIPSVDERTKITQLILSIEELITLHQRKLEKLKLTKKALLQKLFPQNGSKFPELRFKGFTAAWEQCKLSDITEIVMGQSPSSKNYTDNPNDNILVQGNADLKDGKVVPRLWTKEITKTIDKDGIVLTVRAPVGDVAKTDYKVVLGRGVAGIKGNDYIYQFLQKLQNNRYWVSLSSGSTFESINSNDIKDLIIDIPSIEEQTKISMLLNNVNSIITLHQRKLDHLQLQKKALLQQIFV